MFWADRLAIDIIKTKKYSPYWVDDMKTPSGRIHVGSLRGVVVHDLIYRALCDQGVKGKFTYVFEDHDPMDEVSADLDKSVWSKYLGQPLFTVPSPAGEGLNFAQYFAEEFRTVFESIGSHPEIIWISQLYKLGKMNSDIRICLDKADVIRKIYETMYKKKITDNWYPFQAVCPKCGKESTTKTYAWDGDKISFVCQKDAVVWTKGCGYEGKISPFSDKNNYRGKLPWKVEWAVKWKVIGVTIEGAGKDHMSAGGSHDVASMVCKKVIDYQTPYPVSYEFFLIGGKKMSSSKGLGSSAIEVSKMIPPYLLRFLMVRTQINQTIDFDPRGWTIPDLFDEYDRCAKEYRDKKDADLSRIFELSQVEKKFQVPMFLPRFRSICQAVQFPNVNLEEYFSKEKGSKLDELEKEILLERIKYARIWLEKYAPDEAKFVFTKDIPQLVKTLKPEQLNYLNAILSFLTKTKNPQDLQTMLYEKAKQMKMNIKDAFSAIYISLIGKNHGPKAAWLLQSVGQEMLIDRITKVINMKPEMPDNSLGYQTFTRSDLFTIDQKVKEKYPSLTIGLAIIKGVKITENDKFLDKEINEFIRNNSSLTTKMINGFGEIQSYRKVYKETGIDWHSRRPSPEALLRRIAQGKPLYRINTCVDAYNLVVMRNRVSVGAFDLDKIRFPTTIRFAESTDKIRLLGDKELTYYKSGEIAYFDRVEGYNIDFNWRDSERTKVHQGTKNLWINTEGIYDIGKSQVEKTLKETIDIIIKYCGGKLTLAGVIKASD
jgi:lysyl-tRNA synthetase class 1